MSCPLPNVLQPKHADPMRGMQVQLQPLNYHDRKPTAVAGNPRTLCDFFSPPRPCPHEPLGSGGDSSVPVGNAESGTMGMRRRNESHQLDPDRDPASGPRPAKRPRSVAQSIMGSP